MSLKLPKHAQAAFLIDYCDNQLFRLRIHIYANLKHCWCIPKLRYLQNSCDSGLKTLPYDEWKTLLHLIDKCGFWSLPESNRHFQPSSKLRIDVYSDLSIDDGETLAISGRDAKRNHGIQRFALWEPELNGVIAFVYRVSGYFHRNTNQNGWILSNLPSS